MVISYVITLAGGILAAIAAGALLVAAVSDDAGLRERLHRMTAYALGIGGLVLMFGSIAGWQGTDAMCCGLLMVVFGTAIQPQPSAAPKPAQSEPAQ
jgi:hypothetical protein